MVEVDPEPQGTVSSNSSSTGSTLYRTTPLKRLKYNDPSVVESAAFRLSSNHGPAVYGAFAYDNGDAEAIVKRFDAEDGYYSQNPYYKFSIKRADLPTLGGATFDGRVGIAAAERTGYDDNGIAQYTISDVYGPLTLTADFVDQTLTGKSDLIEVDGTYSGRNLAGTVIHDGIEGDLDGRISEINLKAVHRVTGAVKRATGLEALGIFSGSDDERGKTFAGAFRVISE